MDINELFSWGPLTRDINRAKKIGYERALKEAGIEYDDELIIEIENSYDSGYESWKDIKDVIY